MTKYKKAEAELCDFIVVNCPHCDGCIEEYWGRTNDLTIQDPGEEVELDCIHCGRRFIAVLEN